MNRVNRRHPQKDLIEILVKALKINIKPKPPDRKRISFSIIPVSSTTSGGDQILVSSINAAFTFGHIDSTNISSVYFLPYTDLVENFGFGTKINLWTSKNNWNIPVEFRISSLTQYSYGLGSSTEKKDQFRLKYNNVRFYGTANRRIKGYLYAGLGINYDRYYKVSDSGDSTAFDRHGSGTDETSFSTGITINALYDDRKNSINPDHGHYINFIYRVNPPYLANQSRWSTAYLDYREYKSLSDTKRKIIAIWAFYWGSFGDVPYFNLPGTQLEFGQRSGRGFSQSRFRGKHMLYLEAEYRFDISKNGLLGAVLFANVQSLSEADNEQFSQVNPAGGFGARVKFNKQSNTNLTLDFGFGNESFTFTIGLGEFF
ncbi:MAG: BamA/TamA family outer membrane protein [Cyclobacteriaceae bacterium]|nr:BamA/TamA family outer membrane protein [Cyclobacteriaceae bacterium]